MNCRECKTTSQLTTFSTFTLCKECVECVGGYYRQCVKCSSGKIPPLASENVTLCGACSGAIGGKREKICKEIGCGQPTGADWKEQCMKCYIRSQREKTLVPTGSGGQPQKVRACVTCGNDTGAGWKSKCGDCFFAKK